MTFYFILYILHSILENALQESVVELAKGNQRWIVLGLYSCVLNLQAQFWFDYNDIFTTGEFLFPSTF